MLTLDDSNPIAFAEELSRVVLERLVHTFPVPTQIDEMDVGKQIGLQVTVTRTDSIENQVYVGTEVSQSLEELPNRGDLGIYLRSLLCWLQEDGWVTLAEVRPLTATLTRAGLERVTGHSFAIPTGGDPRLYEHAAAGAERQDASLVSAG